MFHNLSIHLIMFNLNKVQVKYNLDTYTSYLSTCINYQKLYFYQKIARRYLLKNLLFEFRQEVKNKKWFRMKQYVLIQKVEILNKEQHKLSETIQTTKSIYCIL